jgi:GMP synthase (glutamine-hydrolysing)
MIGHGLGINTISSHNKEEELPFPYSHHPFCYYEAIEKKIRKIRVLVINNLLRDEKDLSDIARKEWGPTLTAHLQKEQKIAPIAIENISNNILRLVKEPEIKVVHLSEIEASVKEFQPQAIILSGTLSDFDFYSPTLLSNFESFIRTTTIPVLGICGGHQLIGLSFGARVLTLDSREPHECRESRPAEYQYRFIRVIHPEDPIFEHIYDGPDGSWKDHWHNSSTHIIHVWQNHGLQLDRVPEGFQLLATSYRCHNQMMVRRTENQLIYTVQFHLEKSFEDWNKNPTRWEHPNESRDGRIIFENFLASALKHGN